MSAQIGLKQVFDLEQNGENRWLGINDGIKLPQVYGGQILGQTLMAAALSVEPKKLPHSIHTKFLNPGRSDQRIEYQVEKVRDGGLFSVREVDALQNDVLISRSLVSCSITEYEGVGHSRKSPKIEPPESVPTIQQLAEADGGLGSYWDGFSSLEVRIAPPEEKQKTLRSASAEQSAWIRVTEDLGDNSAMNLAAIAYASDLLIIGTSVTPYGYPLGFERTLATDWRAVSLDHSLWFHRELSAQDWMLFEFSTPSAAKGRAVVEASIFGEHDNEERQQAVHLVQEAFVRRAK